MLRRAARLFVLASLLASPMFATAAEGVDIYLFWRPGCPHCEREIAFLQKLEAEQPALRVHYFNLRESTANRELFRRAGQAFGAGVSSVPFTVIGERAWAGYVDDATTGAALRAQALRCAADGCPDRMRALLYESGAAAGAPVNPASELPETVRLPLVGEVALKNPSLPLLTITLGALDGFNPCAMWVLLLLLGILVGEPERLRRWLLGGVFLAASAAVYFLFLAAWLNLFLFVGMLPWVQAAVGAAALLGGGGYLRQYALRRDEVCPVTAPAQRRRVFERLEDLARRRLTLALAGVVLLAAAVNLVELLCSAGLPAVYTRVLTLSHVPPWQYYGYLLLYIAVFLFDDVVVFVAAMTTLEVTGLGTRYARVSRLVGGVVLAVLGVLLLLRPEWLMFG